MGPVYSERATTTAKATKDPTTFVQYRSLESRATLYKLSQAIPYPWLLSCFARTQQPKSRFGETRLYAELGTVTWGVQICLSSDLDLASNVKHMRIANPGLGDSSSIHER